jgi:hypothetical protein
MTTPEAFRFPPDGANPYAPPQSHRELEPTFARPVAVPCTLGGVFERTWEIYRDQMGLAVAVVVMYVVLLGLAAFAYGLVLGLPVDSDAARALVLLLAIPAFGLFVLWISIGLMVVMLDIARGRATSIALFSGGRFLLRGIAAYILLTLAMGATFGTGLLAGFALSRLILATLPTPERLAAIVFAVGLIAGYIAALILSLRLSQFLYLIIDRDVGAAEALRISFAITRGHVPMLFALSLLAGLINTCGMMACGVGMLFTTPYIVLLMPVAYLALTGQRAVDPYARR